MGLPKWERPRPALWTDGAERSQQWFRRGAVDAPSQLRLREEGAPLATATSTWFVQFDHLLSVVARRVAQVSDVANTPREDRRLSVLGAATPARKRTSWTSEDVPSGQFTASSMSAGHATSPGRACTVCRGRRKSTGRFRGTILPSGQFAVGPRRSALQRSHPRLADSWAVRATCCSGQSRTPTWPSGQFPHGVPRTWDTKPTWRGSLAPPVCQSTSAHIVAADANPIRRRARGYGTSCGTPRRAPRSRVRAPAGADR